MSKPTWHLATVLTTDPKSRYTPWKPYQMYTPSHSVGLYRRMWGDRDLTVASVTAPSEPCHTAWFLKEQPLQNEPPLQPGRTWRLLVCPFLGLDLNHRPCHSSVVVPSIPRLAFDEWKAWVWAVMETYRRVKHFSFKKIIISISRHWSGAPFAFQTLKSEGRSIRG